MIEDVQRPSAAPCREEDEAEADSYDGHHLHKKGGALNKYGDDVGRN
jgi:hypothetical protein